VLPTLVGTQNGVPYPGCTGTCNVNLDFQGAGSSGGYYGGGAIDIILLIVILYLIFGRGRARI